MITRRALSILAVVTLVFFGASAALGNHHHGARQVFADIAWNGFLLSLLFLIVASVVVLVRSRGRLRRA